MGVINASVKSGDKTAAAEYSPCMRGWNQLSVGGWAQVSAYNTGVGDIGERRCRRCGAQVTTQVSGIVGHNTFVGYSGGRLVMQNKKPFFLIKKNYSPTSR